MQTMDTIVIVVVVSGKRDFVKTHNTTSEGRKNKEKRRQKAPRDYGRSRRTRERAEHNGTQGVLH